MIYRLTYCNKDGVEARVDIQKGLATPVIEVEGTERPFILSYNNDKGNKSGMFLSSSADIEIYETTDFNINNLKTSNETELSVTHYINNVVSWRGFIIPDFFSIEVRNNPVITMTASDRLGTLKNVTLSDLPTMVNIRELILTCLSKTGLSLPLKTIADFSNDGTVNAFFSYYVDSQRIKDIKGRSISCYDILSSILIASNSKLVQRAGEWVIINKLQHEIGSGKIYSSLSSFTNYLENIYNFEEVSIGARRTIMPVAGSVGIYHEHGGRKSHPANYDYSLDLSGWNSVNGFVATIENRHITGFLGGTPLFDPERTVKQYLLNYNNWIDNTNNLNTAPYISTDAIPINSPRADRVEVTVDISSTMAEKLSSNTAISFLRYAVILTNGVKTYTLTKAGIFEELDPENISGHSLLLRGGQQPPLLLASPAFSNSDSFKGLFEVGEDDNVNNYSATIRVYGSGDQYVTVNYALIKFSDVSELPKGTMYKTEQGEVFTKAHDIETSIFGDYLLSGLDGYFYRYPNDDTSSIYKDINTLSSPIWTTPSIPNETSELPLLHHSTRQMRRMFSVAHDLLRAELEVNNFDPLAIFVSCDKRYTVVSAQFDFFKSNLSVELEEVAFQNANVRDFIYSYFGDGESGIKSIGGISAGTGGGGTGGGGMTNDQISILNDVAELAHYHENKEVLDQITQDIIDNASREMVTSTDTETELSDENYLSSLRVLKEILDNNEYLGTQFLSKVNPDTAQKLIKFAEGLEIGNYTSGLLGSGAKFKMNEGISELEVDKLSVRMRAEFFSVLIHNAKHIGGELIISAADMICNKVEEFSSFYRCYFDRGENNEVNNLFTNQDRARCQVFTGSGQKFYWRKVIAVGPDYIELSKTDASPGTNDIPEVGDRIFQLGSDDIDRQGAMIFSSVGADAPSFKQYAGINSFSLDEEKIVTKFTRLGNRIQGKTVFTSGGSNLDDYLDSTAQDIEDAQAAANAAALKAQQAIDEAEANVGLINTEVGKLQEQLDGEVSNWFYPYTPTLSNYPASDWTDNTIKDRHIGDTFTNTAQAPATDAGKSWRFVKNGSTYSWTAIADSDAVKALLEASKAQATADGKSTTHLFQPTKYKLGDMWVLNADQTVNGTAYKAGEILTATQDSATYNQAHWVKRVRYTDDTAVDNLQIGGRNLFSVNDFVADNKARGYSTINVINYNGNIAYRSSNITNNHLIPRYLQGKFEANTQYYLQFKINWESYTDSGAQYVIRVVYTDGTTSNLAATISQTSRSMLTASGKTINYITTTRQYDGTVVIYEVQIEKSNKASDWTPAPEDVQEEINSAKLTAEQAQLQADGYMRARYVRDWAGRNTANNYSLWYEVKVFNKAGINVAQGKSVEGKRPAGSSPYSNITDGDTTTYGQPSGVVPEGETDWVKIDLGQIYYDIDYIHVWHHSSDSRTYYGTKTEISEDGVNWTTIFDSAIEGTYKETEGGKIHSQRWAKVMANLNRSKAVTDKFGTLVNGGLISPVTVELREADTMEVTAGHTGIQGHLKNLPAYWAGGTYDQAIGGTAKAIIRHDGSSKFTDTEITGTVNATSGEIGDFTIENGKLVVTHFWLTYVGQSYVRVTQKTTFQSSGILIEASYGGTVDHPQVVSWNAKFDSAGVTIGSMELRRDGLYRDGIFVI